MKQRFTLLLLTLLTFTVTFAGPVDLEQARGKAAKFMRDYNNGAQLASEEPEYAPARSVRGTQIKDADPAYYVFNAENECGYVIISGDDKTDEVLAYATNGSFDLESMPENVKAWLQGYAEQIGMLENYVPQKNETAFKSAGYTAVAPLTTTKWNQSEPYNSRCPIHYNERSVTGCTATAMAQVMKYHEWPQNATAMIPAYTTETAKLKLSALTPTKFAWDEMKDTYTYDEEGDAVAKLMLYCGQSIKSDYTKLSTGAYTTDVATALVKYFNYDQNLELKHLDFYSISEWEKLIYDELKAGRPVFHAGVSMGGGHAFVCDGYDGNGMFHFNWGWGGSHDGYYKLALMNPGTGGIGSGSSDGYSYAQEIIIGIQPPTGEAEKPKYLQPDGETITNGTTIYSAFYNMHHKAIQSLVGFATIDKNDNVLEVLYGGQTQLINTYYGVAISMAQDTYGPQLSKGTHRIATVCASLNDYQWKRVGSKQNYFVVEMGDNGKVLNVSMSPVIKAKINCELDGNLVAGVEQKVKVTVTNEGDEMNSVIYLFASPTTTKGEPQSRAAILLKENESIDYILTFTPETSGTYNIWLTQDANGNAVIAQTQVRISPAPLLPSNLSLVKYNIDKNEVSATISIKNNSTEGYYREIEAMLYENLYNDNMVYLMERITLPGNIPSGATKTYNIKFHGAQSYNLCGILIGYYANHNDYGYTELSDMLWFTTGDTPVESIEATPTDKAPVYRLDGTKVDAPAHNGIYISEGKKIIVR